MPLEALSAVCIHGMQSVAVTNRPDVYLRQFAICNLQFAICNSPNRLTIVPRRAP